LSVLDETIDNLRLLSYVTIEILDTAEQLKDVLGEDLVNTLIKHRGLLQNAKSSLSSEPVLASTWELARLLKKSPSATRLQTLHTERSPALLQVLSYFERLRQYAQKRLTTTVEEDNSNREYFEEVKEREERAVAEKLQLEQKLKLQRVELQKQANAVQSAEDKARAELHDVQTNMSETINALQKDSSSTRHDDRDGYQIEYDMLHKELSDAKAQLVRLREEHKENEATLRKTKKRAQQDVESVIGEYDTDVGNKEDEYQKALTEYNSVMAQLEIFTVGYNEMYTERMEYEERERKLAQERLEEGLRRVRRVRAAFVIQGAWKAFKARKAAEAKRRKKLEAAKKKGKK